MDAKEIEIMSQWFDLCYDIGIDLESATSMGQKIVNAYSSSHRNYHTLEHVNHCLSILDQVPIQIDEENDLRFAIWFHDIVYDPKSEENEIQSAQIAYDWLNKQAVGNPDQVRNLILSTANYLEPATDQLSYMVLHDIDLAILASDETIYLQYQKEIREEFSHLQDEEFLYARRKFLKAVLELNPLYAIEAYQHQWEEKARQNISNELKKIEKSINLLSSTEK